MKTGSSSNLMQQVIIIISFIVTVITLSAFMVHYYSDGMCAKSTFADIVADIKDGTAVWIICFFFNYVCIFILLLPFFENKAQKRLKKSNTTLGGNKNDNMLSINIMLHITEDDNSTDFN